MGNLLNKKHVFAKLRAELEKRKEKLCYCCKKFRHLVQNYRNKREEKKRKIVSQNKFEVLKTRVMQYDKREKIIRRQEAIVVKCFKYREKRHKCRECLLWEKVGKRRVVVRGQP